MARLNRFVSWQLLNSMTLMEDEMVPWSYGCVFKAERDFLLAYTVCVGRLSAVQLGFSRRKWRTIRLLGIGGVG